MSNPNVHHWDDSDETWEQIKEEAYETGRALIRFPGRFGIEILYCEDLLSNHPNEAEERTDG